MTRIIKLTRTRRERTCADGALSFKMMAVMAVGFAAIGLTLHADPGWWSSREAVNSNPKNNHLAINKGQLKQFTQKAILELNADLPTSIGAGPTLTDMAASWSHDYQVNGYNSSHPDPHDFQAVNVGQLKYVGSLVYGQLAAAGYTGLYPSWIKKTDATDHYVANIGQLKTVFNFDLSVAPQAVTSVTATAGINEIDLSWTNPPNNPVTSITIVQDNPDGSTTTYTLSPTSTFFAATNLAGGSYTYHIITHNQAVASNAGSTATTPTLSPNFPLHPSTPTGLVGTLNSQGDMNLVWQGSPGASSYSIDREVVSTGTWTTGYATVTSGTSY